MYNEGSFLPGVMTIRVFYPNPVNTDKYYTLPIGIDGISKLHNVTYIEKCDPIYHELVFIDENKVRHQIIGLAYHLEEKMGDAGGIDGVA